MTFISIFFNLIFVRPEMNFPSFRLFFFLKYLQSEVKRKCLCYWTQSLRSQFYIFNIWGRKTKNPVKVKSPRIQINLNFFFFLNCMHFPITFCLNMIRNNSVAHFEKFCLKIILRSSLNFQHLRKNSQNFRKKNVKFVLTTGFPVNRFGKQWKIDREKN